MKSGIKDINGIEVKIGDIISIPYITPFGDITTKESGRFEVVFKHGCFGICGLIDFLPLFNMQQTEEGEYISNYGNKTIYTGEYIFTIV